MRLFTAIPFPEAQRSHLVSAQRRLASSHADVKWVAGGNLHITLRFLGDVDASQISAVESALRHACARHAVGRLQVAGVGAFPHMRAPRVVWAGVREGVAALQQLFGAIEAAVQDLGFEAERKRYTPHVTLGRVRGEGSLAELRQRMEAEAPFDAGSWTPEEAQLIESVLTPQGPRYRVRAQLPLSAS